MFSNGAFKFDGIFERREFYVLFGVGLRRTFSNRNST